MHVRSQPFRRCFLTLFGMRNTVLGALIVMVALSLRASALATEDTKETRENSPALVATLDRAGGNRAQLEQALTTVPAAQYASMEWLITHMPASDASSLDANFLLKHVDGAYTAWKSAPWHDAVTQEVFCDGILPFASVSEARELWIDTLRAKCLPMVAAAKSSGEAAVLLNQQIFPSFKVKYSTARARADQAPSESMQSGLASCTGLSILLIDACRSVGVPARFVGVPMWTDGSGNHSWVEIWDGTAWRFTGAAEPSGDALDAGWFAGRASGQNRDKPEHAIYAVTWRDTGVEFPMVFDQTRARARAIDVTDRYAHKSAEVPEGMELVRVVVRDPTTQLRVARQVTAYLSAKGAVEIIAQGKSKDERFDLNDHLELVVPIGTDHLYFLDGTLAMQRVSLRNNQKLIELIAQDAVESSPKSTVAAPGAVTGRWTNHLNAVMQDGATRKPATVIDSLRVFLKKGALNDVPAQAFAKTRLAAGDIARLQSTLIKQYQNTLKTADSKEFQAKVLEVDGVAMPFWYAVYGEKPKSGRSLYISMHGGGGAPKEVNDKQWENQKKLYTPAEGVYVAPRAPTDTWNLWHQGHIDTLFAKLIRDMIVFEDVDPNHVYIMGYSAGGDGVYQLAPRMADYLAAAAMMAGHPNETKPDGLRNLPFTLHMGGEDKAFDRNEIARKWKVTLDELSAKDPGGYPHEVVVHEGKGHWMDRQDAVAIPWMAKFARELRPQKIVWLQDDVTSARFYWLANPTPKPQQRVVAVRDGQTITIEDATGVDDLLIRLDDSMCQLDERVVVKLGASLGGIVLYDAIPTRTLAVMAKTLIERGDPTGVFSVELAVKIPHALSE